MKWFNRESGRVYFSPKTERKVYFYLFLVFGGLILMDKLGVF